MRLKAYYTTAAILFSVIAVVHFTRAYYGWEVEVAEATIPVWVSWVVVAIAGYLAMRGFQAAKEYEEDKHFFNFWS